MKELAQHIFSEIKVLLAYTVFFTLFFASFTTYRSILFHETHLLFFHYGFDLIEALIISKIVLIGQYFKLGEKFEGKPLIIPVLYKTLLFSLLAVFFETGEHFIGGWLKGYSTQEIYLHLTQGREAEIIASGFIMSFVFFQFFAYQSLKKLIGKDKMFPLFFGSKNSLKPPRK